MTEQEHFLAMLTRAEVAFHVRRTSTQRDLVDVDSGGGALAFFEFDDDGMLVEFDIDREAY